MNCSHNWTVTSECPRCLRAALDRAETERAQAQRELSARAARPLAIRQRDEAVARAEAAEARWSAEQATALEALRQAEAAEARVRELEAALTKINAIRDSIVGVQGFNFSEHAYPLVAALNEAGFEGLPYPEARENVGTLIERANRAEARVAELETENARLLEIATDARIDRTQLRAVRDAAEAVCNDSQGVDAICEGVLKRHMTALRTALAARGKDGAR